MTAMFEGRRGAHGVSQDPLQAVHFAVAQASDSHQRNKDMDMAGKYGYGSKPCTPGEHPISMNIIVFIGMFTYAILMVLGINPWPYELRPQEIGCILQIFRRPVPDGEIWRSGRKKRNDGQMGKVAQLK